MDKELREMLIEEIKEEIRSLSKLTPGSKEYESAVKNISTLYQTNIDELKTEFDCKEMVEKRHAEFGQNAIENSLKADQLREQKIDRWCRIAIGGAEILLPLIFYGVWMRRGFKFEENGTYTSTTFRNLFNRFRPTRK